MRHVTCMFSFLLTVVHCMWRVMSRCPPCTSCGESCARVHRARHVDAHATSTPMEAWKGPCLNMKTHVHRPKHRSACQHDKLHDNMSGRMSTQYRTACGRHVSPVHFEGHDILLLLDQFCLVCDVAPPI